MAVFRRKKNPPFSGPSFLLSWLRGKDLNLRPLGYEPNELPDCSTPQIHRSVAEPTRQIFRPKLLLTRTGLREPPQPGFLAASPRRAPKPRRRGSETPVPTGLP